MRVCGRPSGAAVQWGSNPGVIATRIQTLTLVQCSLDGEENPHLTFESWRMPSTLTAQKWGGIFENCRHFGGTAERLLLPLGLEGDGGLQRGCGLGCGPPLHSPPRGAHFMQPIQCTPRPALRPRDDPKRFEVVKMALKRWGVCKPRGRLCQ